LELRKLLEVRYTDGITAIPEASTDGDNITGIFEDKVSEKLTKRYQFTITQNDVSYGLINGEDVELAEIDFAAGKTKNCTKGTPCKGTCIHKDKECRDGLGDAEKQSVQKITKTKSKTATPQPSVQPAKTVKPEIKTKFKINDNEPQLQKDLTQWESERKRMSDVIRIRQMNQQADIAEQNSKKILNDPPDKNYKAKGKTFTRDEMAKEYAAEAAAMRKLAAKEEKKAAKNNNQYLGTDDKRLHASMSITEEFTTRGAAPGTKRVGLYDEKGNVQGAMEYKVKKDHVYVEYLATAPWNNTKSDKSVRGAGTEGLIQAVQISKQQGYKGKVVLEALPDSAPFYEKMGFKPVPGKTLVYQLDPKSAEELLKKYGSS
jgi:hypothetical protein